MTPKYKVGDILHYNYFIANFASLRITKVDMVNNRYEYLWLSGPDAGLISGWSITFIDACHDFYIPQPDPARKIRKPFFKRFSAT